MAVSYCTQVETALQPAEATAYAELRAILDGLNPFPILSRLQLYRCTGRPGHPLRALWRAYVTSFLLNLPHTNALIRRLQEDPELCRLCGFECALPSRRTFNRFIARLSHHSDLVEVALVGVTSRLKEVLPDLGEVVAIDSTAVRSHSNPNRRRRKQVSDAEARWGVKHSAKAKEKGTDWFFGYKSHAVADVKYGVPLAHIITAGNRNDSPMLPKVMRKGENLYSWWGPKVAIADRGYDGKQNHEWLDKRGVLPIIHIKELAKKGLYGGIYTKTGVPTCLGGIPMEYAETDPATGNYLYICAESGCRLKSSMKGGVTYCDSEVWEDPREDIRLFGKIRRDSAEWKAYYSQRQAIERVFKSLKESRRLERHCVRGLRQIRLHVLMSVLAFQATALVKVLAGDLEEMRWMVRRVA